AGIIRRTMALRPPLGLIRLIILFDLITSVVNTCAIPLGKPAAIGGLGIQTQQAAGECKRKNHQALKRRHSATLFYMVHTDLGLLLISETKRKMLVVLALLGSLPRMSVMKMYF